MTARKKLVLIDGMSAFHRGYHGMPGLANSQGQATGAVYGFTAMMLKMLSEIKPDYVIVAWDKAKTSTRSRLALSPDYKAKRITQPDDFYAQIPLVMKVIEAMGWPLYELDDYEADDIIGALAAQGEKHGLETIVMTSDMDALQILDEHTKVYASRKGLTDMVIYDLKALDDKYGLNPEQFLDYKALRGDSSDNIPGVPGIGEKTGLSLLHEYGSLDKVYKNLDKIGEKVRAKLVAGKELAYLSKQLATIMIDAPVKLELDKSRVDQIDRQKIHQLFKELDFKSLLGKLPVSLADEKDEPNQSTPNRSHLERVKYIRVDTQKQLDELVSNLNKTKIFAFDTETDSVDTLEANLVGLSFSFEEAVAYYIPVGHSASVIASKAKQSQLDRSEVLSALKPLLENPKVGKTGHNLKFDYQILRRYGITLSPTSFDTMIASFLVNPLGRAQSLDDLSYRELGIEMIPITELIGKSGKDQRTFDLVSLEDATRYAAEDADISWRLYSTLKKELEKAKLTKLAEDLEWPLIPILAEMELAGIELDVKFLAVFNKKISAKILELEKTIYKLAAEKFNISSPAQLSKILYDKLGLEPHGVKKGKSGGLSTAAKELEKMRGMHPIIEHLFEYRELAKLKSTYVDALPELVARDGRIHTSFNQTIAQTGRLSSTNPNLQNIPARTEIGREIRKAFVAPKGRVFVSADYSQFELRIAAALAKDKAMIAAFAKGIDIHLQTAAELFDKPIDQITKEERYAAKTINFGVLYGMSAHGLSVATGMDNKQATDFIKKYYELKPDLKKYIEEIKASTRKNEYAETLFGRRRPLPEINSNNFVIANAAERMAVNVPIQGTQADIMKMAMIALAPKLDQKSKLLLQIHDELVVETDEPRADKVAKLMKETMESIYDLGVKIEVDTSIGTTWGELG